MEEGGDGGDFGGFSWVGRMMGYLGGWIVFVIPHLYVHTNVYMYVSLSLPTLSHTK